MIEIKIISDKSQGSSFHCLFTIFYRNRAQVATSQQQGMLPKENGIPFLNSLRLDTMQYLSLHSNFHTLKRYFWTQHTGNKIDLPSE